MSVSLPRRPEPPLPVLQPYSVGWYMHYLRQVPAIELAEHVLERGELRCKPLLFLLYGFRHLTECIVGRRTCVYMRLCLQGSLSWRRCSMTLPF